MPLVHLMTSLKVCRKTDEINAYFFRAGEEGSSK